MVEIFSEFLRSKIMLYHLWNISHMPKVSILFSSNVSADFFWLLTTC